MFFSSETSKESIKKRGYGRFFFCGTVFLLAFAGNSYAETVGPQSANAGSLDHSSSSVAVTPDKRVEADNGQAMAAGQSSSAATTFKTCPVSSALLYPPEKAGRILVIGDSQGQGLARGIRWLYRKNRAMVVRDYSKPSTGLIKTDFYDWPNEVHKLATTVHANVAVIFFGANDRPDVREHGVVDAKDLARFTKIYSARVRDIITTLKNAHIPVIWVGHPMNRNAKYSEDMKILNKIFMEQAELNQAEFVPLWTVFSEDGHFAPYGEGVDGVKVRLRLDDGVHLTPEGYEKAAKLLEPVIACYQPSPS